MKLKVAPALDDMLPTILLRVGQDYRYERRSPIYLLVTERAGVDTHVCAAVKLAPELKGGTLPCATPAVPPAAPQLEIPDHLDLNVWLCAYIHIVQILYYHL